ncbi:MAG: clostripain-related cysteine peptidase, partial [bacterium]
KHTFLNTDELETIGSDENTHIVSVLDVGNQEGLPHNGAKIFYLKEDGEIGKINSPLIGDLGKVNMADPNFMAEVLKEIVSKFPAENVAIFVDSHGYGWKGVIQDNDSAAKVMKIGELREALDKVKNSIGKMIDVLVFDASFMAMFEVGYELKDVIKYMVASQEYIRGGGINYAAALNGWKLLSNKIKPMEFAEMIVNNSGKYNSDEYNVFTMSALDLDFVIDVAEVLNSLAREILREDSWKMPYIIDDIARSQEFSKIDDLKPFHRHQYRDLIDFVENFLGDNPKAERVLRVLRNFVITAASHSSKYEYANGVSIELPLYKIANVANSEEYKETLFAKDTLWDEMLNRIYEYARYP